LTNKIISVQRQGNIVFYQEGQKPLKKISLVPISSKMFMEGCFSELQDESEKTLATYDEDGRRTFSINFVHQKGQKKEDKEKTICKIKDLDQFEIPIADEKLEKQDFFSLCQQQDKLMDLIKKSQIGTKADEFKDHVNKCLSSWKPKLPS